MDKTENSSKGELSTSLGRPYLSQPQAVWGVTPSTNMAHKMCTPHMVSTRSLGHYAWGCISGILPPENTWGYGNTPSKLRLCDAGANNVGPAKQSVKRKKVTLRTYITAKTPAYQKGSQETHKAAENQSHTIAYQVIGNSSLAAWISSTVYQILPQPVKTHSAVLGHLS